MRNILSLVISGLFLCACSSDGTTDSANLIIPAGETVELETGTHTYNKIEVNGALKVKITDNSNLNVTFQTDEFIVGENGIVEGGASYELVETTHGAYTSTEVEFIKAANILIESTSVSVTGKIRVNGIGKYDEENESAVVIKAGSINIVADTLKLMGEIQADGADGIFNPSDSSSTGGGAAGDIEFAIATVLEATGSILARGGKGVSDSYHMGPFFCGPTSGGNGGKISITPDVSLPNLELNVEGGVKGSGALPPPGDTDCGQPHDGEDGTVIGFL